jgi:ABC-type uncharacterized transport system permease subunit
VSETPKKRAATVADELTTEAKAASSRFFETLISKLYWTLGSIVLALLVAALFMLANGHNPGLAYASLLRYSILHFDEVLWYATPFTIAGLSIALAFKCGLFNIGAEGQLNMGALAGTMVGYMIALPVIVHPLACLAVGAVVGMLFGLLPGILKAYRGAHEVVTTMMLSYIAGLFCTWAVAGPLKEQGPYQYNAQTPPLLPTAILPRLVGPYLNWGFFVAIACVIGVQVLLQYTVLGYELRAVGLNPRAAEAAGINPRRAVTIALALSGMLAGIAGIEEIMGYYHRFQANWSGGLGFDGITVSVLGGNSPLGCLGAAIFFGFLRAGSNSMQTTAHVPVEMVGVIQGLIVLFVAAPTIIDWLANRGVSYAVWLRTDARNAVPSFLVTALGVIGAIIGFGIGAMYLALIKVLGPSVLVGALLATASLITIAAVALAAFIGAANRKTWGAVCGLISSTAWVGAGICNFVFEHGTLVIPLAVLGILGIAVAGLILYRPKPKAKQSRRKTSG